MQNLLEKKNKIRVRLLEQRKALEKTARSSRSEEIKKRVLASSEFAAAKIIHFYLSDDVEVQTDALIKESLRLGKQVVIPLFDQPAVSKITDIHPNHFETDRSGIRHLKEPFYKAVLPATVDLWIIPGVGYDRMGHRLGRGSGFYDKLLSGISAKTIGLAFECQVVDAIPFGEHDKPVNQIITEEQTIICKAGGENKDENY